MRLRTILFSCLTVIACADVVRAAQPRTPDTIYFHGKVYTMDDALGTQTAFAVRGERVVAVGSDAEVMAMAGKATRRVDLKDAAVIPGLTDSHDHFWNTGKYLVRGVDLVGVDSRAELDSRLRAAVAGARPGDVIYTTVGWAVQPAPTRADLDAISASVPIALIRNRRAVAVVNSAALRRLGISKENATFNGAKLPLDKQGELTGETPGYPAAIQMIDALLPPLSSVQQELLLKQAMQQRNALGITSVRELAVWPDVVRSLQRLRRAGKFTLRVALGVEFPEQSDLPAYIAKQPALRRNDPWLFVDSLSEEPWSPGSATAEEFTRLVRAENRSGWRPAPHTSWDPGRGTSADVATDATLAAYEAADHDSPLPGKRWYVEHVPLSTPTQMERMAQLGLIVSTQDYGSVALPATQVPPDRLAHLNPTRGFLDHKIVVIGGSDYNGPTPLTREPNNPLNYFYFYVTRRNKSGEVQQPAEKITREEALRIFTVNPAYATFQESIKGKIAPDMVADFVILNQDLMSVPDDRILSTRPLATFVGGEKVYEAAGSGF
jgi:predicted amidohydrolase YtcJ